MITLDLCHRVIPWLSFSETFNPAEALTYREL